MSFVHLSQDRETCNFILKLLREVRALGAEHDSVNAFVLHLDRILQEENLRRVRPLKTVVLGELVEARRERLLDKVSATSTQTAEVTIYLIALNSYCTSRNVVVWKH